jgi:tRNA-binding protein
MTQRAPDGAAGGAAGLAAGGATGKASADATVAARVRPFAPPGSATIEDFDRLDIRVGRIVDVQPFPEARKAAYKLVIDFGPAGTRTSSAQLPPTYPDPEVLLGRLIVAVVDFAPRRVAGFESQVLVLGALPADGRIPLLGVDAGASPGDPVA